MGGGGTSLNRFTAALIVEGKISLILILEDMYLLPALNKIEVQKSFFECNLKKV